MLAKKLSADFDGAWIRGYEPVLPPLGFSDCGTSAYHKDHLGIACVWKVKAVPRYPAVINNVCNGDYTFVFKDAVYYFRKECGSTMTVGYRVITGPNSRHSGYVKIKELFAWPSSTGKGYKTILLGIGEATRMRVLFCPTEDVPRLEMRTLQFTFAELSARLHKLWEVRE